MRKLPTNMRVAFPLIIFRKKYTACGRSSAVPQMENFQHTEQPRSVCGAAAIRAGKFSPKTDFADACGEWCGDEKRDLQLYFRKSLKYLARPGGFEPPAKSLEGSCSIHLSYERVLSL